MVHWSQKLTVTGTFPTSVYNPTRIHCYKAITSLIQLLQLFTRLSVQRAQTWSYGSRVYVSAPKKFEYQIPIRASMTGTYTDIWTDIHSQAERRKMQVRESHANECSEIDAEN